MLIDSSQFPLVYIRVQPDASAEADGQPAQLLAMSALLHRAQAFVFLGGEDFGQKHEHTQEDRKQLSLWMKQNKTAIRAYTKAMILVEKNTAKRLAAQAAALMFGKFWGYPLLIAASDDAALAMAKQCLSDA